MKPHCAPCPAQKASMLTGRLGNIRIYSPCNVGLGSVRNKRTRMPLVAAARVEQDCARIRGQGALGGAFAMPWTSSTPHCDSMSTFISLPCFSADFSSKQERKMAVRFKSTSKLMPSQACGGSWLLMESGLVHNFDLGRLYLTV